MLQHQMKLQGSLQCETKSFKNSKEIKTFLCISERIRPAQSHPASVLTLQYYNINIKIFLIWYNIIDNIFFSISRLPSRRAFRLCTQRRGRTKTRLRGSTSRSTSTKLWRTSAPTCRENYMKLIKIRHRCSRKYHKVTTQGDTVTAGY